MSLLLFLHTRRLELTVPVCIIIMGTGSLRDFVVNFKNCGVLKRIKLYDIKCMIVTCGSL